MSVKLTDEQHKAFVAAAHAAGSPSLSAWVVANLSRAVDPAKLDPGVKLGAYTDLARRSSNLRRRLEGIKGHLGRVRTRRASRRA